MPVNNRGKLGTRSSRVFLAAISTVALVGSLSSGTIAHADAFYHYYPTAVQVNGTTVSAPGHIATKDPFGGASAQVTSFLPIWYVDQALGKFGVTVSWGGSNGVLNLTTPSDMQINYPSAPNPVAINSGTMVIQINGKAVAYAPRISYYDQGSSGIVTTFVPVYYLEKALGYMGVQTGWDGTHWAMQHGDSVAPAAGETLRAAAAVAFAKAAGIKPDPSGANPYSDVSEADWPVIHSLVQDFVLIGPDGYARTPMNAPVFQAASSSTFGHDVTASDIDRALQIAGGWKTGHDAYLPGGSVIGFGSSIGLNQGVPTTGNLSQSDVDTLMSNLATIEKGYMSLGNNKYQLVYKPMNPGPYWDTIIPASIYAQDEVQGISVINKTVVTYLGGNNFETQIPGYSDVGAGLNTGNYIDLTGTVGPEKYSLDGGKTWKTADGGNGYDSIDPANGGVSYKPANVLIKDTIGGGGVCVYFQYDGQSQTAAIGGVNLVNGQIVANYS